MGPAPGLTAPTTSGETHGVTALNARQPQPGDDGAPPHLPGLGAASVDTDTAATRSSTRKPLPWSELLRRVFSIDVLVCPKCAGPLTVIAYLTNPPVLRKILSHLDLPTTPPPLAPARYPEQQLDLFDEHDHDHDDDNHFTPGAPPRPSGRSPPSPDPPLQAAVDRTVDPDHDWGA